MFDDESARRWKPSLPSWGKAKVLQQVSAWWDEVHQLSGLPYSCFTSIPRLPGSTRGALVERWRLWKLNLPDAVLALPRGGYGALWLRVRTGGGAGKAEEQLVDAELTMAGNLVLRVKDVAEAKEVVGDYVAGKYKKPDEAAE